MFHANVKDYKKDESNLGDSFLSRVYITTLNDPTRSNRINGKMHGNLLARYKANESSIWLYIVICDDGKQREFSLSEIFSLALLQSWQDGQPQPLPTKGME